MRPFSQCRQDGRLNATDIHVDHNPPLEPHERTVRAIVCNILRVGCLCRSCHSRKTLTEQRRVAQ
jgi:hypothetical protein